MAHIFRLALIGAIFSLLLALNAWASAPLIKYGYRTPDSQVVTGAEYDSADAACAAGLPICGGNCGGLDGWTGFADGNICNKYKPGVGVSGPTGSWFSVSVCPLGYKLEGGQCISDGTGGGGGNDDKCKGLPDWCVEKKKLGLSQPYRAPGMPNDFACIEAGEPYYGDISGWNPAFPGCTQGCLMSAGINVATKDDDGKWWTSGDGKYVGSVCNPDVINKLNEGTPDEKEIKPPEAKPPGKCNGQKGTYNGVEVCLPYNEAKGDDKVKTENKSDGTKKETTSKTTCTFSQCSTETKVVEKDKSGNTTNTNTTVTNVSKDEYCTRNAGSAVCKALNPNDKSGSGGSGGGGGGGGGGGKGKDDEEKEKEKSKFGGGCSAGYTCEGDAIQCAMAREQHKRACELFVNESDESRLYKSEVAKGRDRDVTKDLPGNKEIDVSGKLSKDDLLGGARCISDLNVTVWRTSVSLPLSKICPGLEYMGWVLVAVSSLVAFRIVSGSSKDS